jgi:hypothetical protein
MDSAIAPVESAAVVGPPVIASDLSPLPPARQRVRAKRGPMTGSASGGKGIGGLRPPFLVERTPMLRIGYGWGTIFAIETQRAPHPDGHRSRDVRRPSPPLAARAGGG